MPYYITVIGDKALINDLNRIKNRLGYTREDILDQTASVIKRDLRAAAPSFTGALRSSIEVILRRRDERWIGPSGKGSSVRFPPSRYAEYVEGGGGPTAKLPNVQDISLRMGIPIGEAFAFAKYLRDSGKAVRTPSFFAKGVAARSERLFHRMVESWVGQIVR